MLRIETGLLRGTGIETVPDSRTRYTTALVRRSLSSMIDFRDRVCADLFCGSGIVGFEMLSNGARHVTFVDTSARAITTVRKNVRRLELSDKVRVVRSDVRRFLEVCGEKFDVVFADPPYELGLVKDILPRASKLLADGALLILQVSKRERPELDGSEGLVIVREKAYGDTLIFFLQKI